MLLMGMIGRLLGVAVVLRVRHFSMRVMRGMRLRNGWCCRHNKRQHNQNIDALFKQSHIFILPHHYFAAANNLQTKIIRRADMTSDITRV
jgi:hypothetical protein